MYYIVLSCSLLYRQGWIFLWDLWDYLRDNLDKFRQSSPGNKLSAVKHHLICPDRVFKIVLRNNHELLKNNLLSRWVKNFWKSWQIFSRKEGLICQNLSNFFRHIVYNCLDTRTWIVQEYIDYLYGFIIPRYNLSKFILFV